MTELTSDQERFMSYVQKDETSGCWRWTGSKAITGYCNFFYRQTTFLAHRASLLVFERVKELTPGLNVSHSCRNRDCVNPDHLSQKTKSENNGPDKVRDGVDNSGERCHFSKLDWSKVKEIRLKKSQDNTIRLKKLSQEYGVSTNCISSVLRCKTWKE